MLLHTADILSDLHNTSEPLSAAEYNALVQVLDYQLMGGALEGLGEGVIEGLAVTAGTGLSAEVAAGKCLVRFDTGLVYLDLVGALTLTDLPDNATALYVWIEGLTPDVTDYDSRRGADCRIVWNTANTPPANSLPLALCTTSGGAVTVASDLRTYCPARQASTLAAAVAALQTAVGTGYSNPQSLDTRVTALETTGGSESGGYRIWKDMPRDVADSTTPEQAMDARDTAAIAAHVASYHAGESDDGSAPELTQRLDLDPANRLRMTLRLIRTVDPDLLDCQVNVFAVVWGVSGDGTARYPGGPDTPDNVDWVNSTWTG